MDFTEVLKDVKEKFPKNALELKECFELIKITSDDLVDALGKKINKLFQNKQYDKVESYNRLAIYLDNYANKINESISILGGKEVEKHIIPNYDDFLVNKEEEYSLLDNLTYKRPFAFSFRGSPIIRVDSWKHMTILILEKMYDINGEKMLSFEHTPHMNGKKRKYFAKDKRELHTPKAIKGKIYIESNQSANSLKTLMLKVLREYGYSEKDVKVYLRADYTELNKK